METITKLGQIACRLELGDYPPELEAYYQDSDAPGCDLELICRLQETYGLFAEFYDTVVRTAEQINGDPDLNTWVRTAAKFYRENEKQLADKLPVPDIGDDEVRNFMMLHILMPTIPDGFASMQARGFSWDEQEDMRLAYAGGMRIVEKQTGHPGVNKSYYSWLGIYARGQIFKTEGFWFQLRKFPPDVLWLRNRKTGDIMPLMGGTFCSDGSLLLGSKNAEDPTEAFAAEYSEDAENYYGHGCVESVTSRQKEVYPKIEWECVGTPDMYCLGIHIPRNADISGEATLRTCRRGIEVARERFPEYGNISCIVGVCWLFNPKLKAILPGNSRILQFQNCFTTYPHKDPKATAVFNFVFTRVPEKWEDLAEDSSLQRKLKQMYLDGDCLHVFGGGMFL